MAKEWQKILDEFSSGKSSTSPSTSAPAQASSPQKTSSNWQGILDDFSGSKKQAYTDYSNSVASRVITSARKKKEEEEKKKRKWFEKGLFEDGYDFGDISRTILGTTSDVLENLGSGIIGMGEKAVDALAYIAPYAENAQFYQNGGGYNPEIQKQHEKVVEQSKKDLGKFIAKDLYDEEKVARAIISDPLRKAGIDSEAHSVFGEKSDALIQSGGQLLATAGLSAAGMPWWLTTGVTSFGGEAENAVNQGASYEAAGASAAISAGAEILSEKLSGGISFGGKTLDDALTKQLARGISNKLGRTAAKLGLDMVGEGAEEVFSQVASNLGSSLYKEEDITELLFNEEAMDGYLESFIGGAALGGVSNAYNVVKSNSKGVDYTSGLTQNEQKVVDKLYKDEIASREKEGKVTQKEKSEIYDRILNDMDKGYISIDTIEEVLGGEKYSQYKQTAEWEDSLQTEFDTLNKMKQGDMTGEQVDRREELRTQIQNVKATSSQTQLRSQIRDEVMGLVKGDRLAESYNERVRTGQKFEADVTKYDTKQQAVVQKAIDSGILNNSNRTHEFVDFVSKISADTGVLFDFSNTAKIREAGFAVEGQTVDGFITKDGITVNIDSPKSRQFVVGHEVTHALEGTELYDALRKSVFDYAKMKNQYGVRMESIQKRYKEGTDYEAELTADLVGEYIFSDTDFINNLSTQNRNVFQKVYDEIKYLCKVATAGSKEARELEKVKRAFEKAYREGGAQKNTAESGVKYALSKDADGNVFVDVTEDIFDTNDGESIARTIQRVIAERFNNLIDVHGQKIQINKTTNDEFRRSNSASGVLAGSEQAYKDKLRTIANADEILSSARNWIGEATKHHRKDDIVEFARADVMYRVGENGYVADVLVGTRKNGAAVLYDLVNIYEKKITEAPVTMASDSRSQRRQDASAKQMLPQKGEKVKFSLSDSTGKQLTKEQQEYFKDSKMRDENGNLKVMYHGTPNGDFTVFKDGTYFTDNKEYADRYQNPGASSISTGKEAKNPKTFEVYLDIKKPFDLSDAEARNIYINDYIKGGNAMGINPYLSDAEYAKINSIDWTEGEDLREFLIENEYDYDGLVLDEGGTGGYGDEVQSRGKSYVVFSPEQVKNVDNAKPTADPDIRFSLSNPVEETKDLMALHNLTSEKLMKSLKLGGLPMPSVAIAKAKDGHSEFGEISLILPRETIDPETSSRNKLYSGDAWTPTYPKVDFKPSNKVLKNAEKKISSLVPYEVRDALGSIMLDEDNARDSLDRYNGNMVEAYKNNDAMKYAYLKDTGSDISLPMKEADLYHYGGHSNAAVRYFSGKLVNGLQTVNLYQNMGAREVMQDKALMEAIADAQNFDVLRTMKPGSAEYLEYERNPVFHADDVSFRDVDNFLSAARKLFTKGVQQTVDRNAAREQIRSAVDQAAYESWLGELFSGIIEKEGIRNNKDYFTPSGNRRSFEALHYEHNLENVIKAMREKGEKGIGFGGGSIFGAATTEFSSVDEMKQASGRLQQMSEEEYQKIKDGFSKRFFDLASSLPKSKNSWTATDDAANTLTEAVAKYQTKRGIANYLRRELDGWANYSPQVVDDLIELVNDIRSMPTGYFEAKPQRAVSFEEVGVFVIPYDADVKLKQELLNKGYSIAEYDPKVEGDRTRVLNQFEEYKFSLSNVGEQHTSDSLSALRLQTAEESTDIAPVAENATQQQETQLTEENATVAPVTAEDMSALFPNDAVPVQAELEQLVSERDQLYKALEIAVDRGSAAEVGKLAEEYEALNARIKALESGETERAGSLTDADVPPEMEAPYQPSDEDYEGTPETVDDPFEERDIGEVGKQSVKAYQYENPEVKPFFQEAALGMLYDVRNTTKGEKWYNDELYYATGGEQGFGGTKRHTTDDIAELKDVYGYTYEQIENGLNAIIEDDGKENNAVSKRIEFMLNDRLLDGYTDVDGRRYEPNQGYVKLLNEKQITEYSKEAFDSFMANADQYAPGLEEAYAPILNSDPRYEQIAPVYDLPGGQQTYVPTKATYDATPTDDIAPLFDATGKKGVPDGQQAFMPDAGEDVKQTRKEYHQSIIDNIKSIFKGRGFDFDKVLKDAKNLSTWSTVDNTPQRVMEKALGYKEGGILADITVNKVAQNETEGIKWLNSYVDQLKQISKQYGIKPGSKESAAAQMYAEGFYVNENNEIIRYGDPELIQDFGNGDVRRRIKSLARDPRIRKIYDDTLANINASRSRNLYPEIPRLDNYFLHFRAMEDTFSTLGLPFNPNDIRAKDLPTDLNGVTADLKPGQPYFASANHRTGKRTSFDLLGGVERYLNSAKNQIYHIDDIQTLRALRNYIAETYGQATGLEDIDSMTDAEAEERIKQVYDSHLSTFAKFLNEEANVLAGKTALIDRGIEGIIGRRGITFLNALNKQVGSNMVGYNVSSSLTNFLPVAQTFAKTNKFDFTKAFAQTVANKISGGRLDSFAEDSPVVIRRKGEDRFYRTPWQKMADPGYALMSMVDDISTEIIARTKYNEFTRKGMDSQKAHFETDKWVSKLMGDRSLGQQPQLYNSKMLGLVTKFQLEVRNQLDSQFYDTIQETKVSNEHIQNGLARNAKTAAKVTSVFAQLAVAQHLYGMAFESVAGYNPAFDIIEVLMTAFGYDDEEDSEDTLKDNLGQGFEALMEDLPYASIVTGGGRIPISSALPIKEFFKGEDQYGNEKNRWETLGEVAPYYLMPGGYGQAKKTSQGLKMFSDDHPIAGSYTDAGNLRYDVEDTVGSRIKAGIFGQYASENAQKYFDQEQRTLNPEQTEIFAGLNIPIEEYWDYRENLYEFYDVRDALKDAAYADGATDEDVLRYTYINDIYGDIYDLYDKQKELASGSDRGKTLELRKIQNQMSQMISESKYGVDSMKLTGAYAEVGGVRYNKDADSGRWYEIKPKNADGSDNWYYQKEQEVTKGLGISYEAYWNNREEYNFAYDKPGRYAIAQAVGGYDSYREYYDVLENWQSDNYISADKDKYGNSISGSRKKKVLDYINGLDLDYGERIILYRTVYSSKTDKRTYNQQIIDYLNERDDISYAEMKSILEELEMVVDSNGYITW